MVKLERNFDPKLERNGSHLFYLPFSTSKGVLRFDCVDFALSLFFIDKNLRVFGMDDLSSEKELFELCLS